MLLKSLHLSLQLKLIWEEDPASNSAFTLEVQGPGSPLGWKFHFGNDVLAELVGVRASAFIFGVKPWLFGISLTWKETDPWWVEAYSIADYNLMNAGDVL